MAYWLSPRTQIIGLCVRPFILCQENQLYFDNIMILIYAKICHEVKLTAVVMMQLACNHAAKNTPEQQDQLREISDS